MTCGAIVEGSPALIKFIAHTLHLGGYVLLNLTRYLLCGVLSARLIGHICPLGICFSDNVLCVLYMMSFMRINSGLPICYLLVAVALISGTRRRDWLPREFSRVCCHLKHDFDVLDYTIRVDRVRVSGEDGDVRGPIGVGPTLLGLVVCSAIILHTWTRDILQQILASTLHQVVRLAAARGCRQSVPGSKLREHSTRCSCYNDFEGLATRVGVARALVKLSKFEGSISVHSFLWERIAHPGARSAPGARTVVLTDDKRARISEGSSANVQCACRGE